MASWEPGIGSDENPHREAIMFYNKNAMGPYDYSVVDLPLAEMFFPSPGIGYSRVEVKSIHRIKTLEKDGEVVKLKNPPSFQVTEYFTTKDFPTKVSYTPLSEYNAKDEYKTGALSQFCLLYTSRCV